MSANEFLGFFNRHPVAAGGSFVVGTAVGYGVSHAYLDIQDPYALGIGLTVGTASTFALASMFYISDKVVEAVEIVGDGLVESGKAITDKKVWQNTGEAIIDGTVISDVAEGLGLVESDDIDLDHYIKDGTAEQKAAAKQARDAMNSLLFTTGKAREEKYAEMVAAMKRLKYLIQLEADANGNANDARFTTNNDNPPETEKVDVVMDDEEIPLNSAQQEQLAKRIAALTVKTAIGSKQAREAAKKELEAALKELSKYKH